MRELNRSSDILVLLAGRICVGWIGHSHTDILLSRVKDIADQINGIIAFNYICHMYLLYRVEVISVILSITIIKHTIRSFH